VKRGYNTVEDKEKIKTKSSKVLTETESRKPKDTALLKVPQRRNVDGN
jgi:hypothetical protein